MNVFIMHCIVNLKVIFNK